MIYDLHRDTAGCGFIERPGGVAVQRCPGFFVDLGFQCGFEGFVGITCTQEVGVADEEVFHVVIGIDEPAGDAFGAVTAGLAGIGVEDIDAVYLDLDLAVFGVEDVNIRLAEDDEEVALTGVFQIIGHVQVGIHPGLEHRDAAEVIESRGMGVIVEGAGDQCIETGIASLAGGGDKIGAGDSAELGADKDGGPLFAAGTVSAFLIPSFGADHISRPGGECSKDTGERVGGSTAQGRPNF
jgi:hypothetical protein